jgi:luciferase-like monooxygenase
MANQQKPSELPQRFGPKPDTTHPSREHPEPHKQISQIAPLHMQEQLFMRAQSLPGVTVGKSLVSVPGARAFHLDEVLAHGPAGAFQRGREFAHIHPAHDGSLHMTLPHGLYEEVLAKGWGEPHPVSGTMMVWGPRTEEELEVIWTLVRASYAYATGEDELEQ